MTSPQYLYHGSPYRFETLVPQQARGAKDTESLFALYAAEKPEWVIPFALPIRWYPDNPQGRRDFSCEISGENVKTKLIYGSVDPNGTGYVYKLKADASRRDDSWQWVTERPCVPVAITEIKVRDYLHTIEFSEEARRITETLYGSF